MKKSVLFFISYALASILQGWIYITIFFSQGSLFFLLKDGIEVSLEIMIQAIILLVLFRFFLKKEFHIFQGSKIQVIFAGFFLGLIISALHLFVFINIPILTFWIGYFDLPLGAIILSNVLRFIISIFIWLLTFKLIAKK